VKPVQIIAADDERTRIPFVVPIKGRRPLKFSVPRFDFIPDDEAEEMEKEIEALGTETMSLRKYTRTVALLMLKRFVSEKDYKVLETLLVAQLDQIQQEWRENSQVSLGESEASENSSTESTEAQSDTTSSPSSESSGQTSDTPSAGTP
jgi:hypothetical protein